MHCVCVCVLCAPACPTTGAAPHLGPRGRCAVPPAPRSLRLARAQDTEFPGVVARPIGSFGSHTDYHYQTLRCNVDLLKLIQLGLTFADEGGNLVEDCPTWQFNFQCDLECVWRVVACVWRVVAGAWGTLVS